MKLDNIITKRVGKTIYRDGKNLIKLFDEDFSKSDILNEALNQSRVEETCFNVPKILEVTKINGKWAIIMEFIEGKTLDVLMSENPKKESLYLERFVNLQLKMHSHQAPLLNKLKDKMDRRISETKLSATMRYELHMRLNGMPKHTKLCHGDFNPSNVIVGDDGNDYVIDWSHATQGNASADAARTYLYFMLNSTEELAEKYMHLFCEKGDIARQYVNSWLPIVAANQYVKGKKEEKGLLLRWLDVVEFE